MDTPRLVLPVCLLLTSCANPPEVRGAPAHVQARPAREENAEPLYLAALAAAQREPAQVLDALEAALQAGACPTRTLTETAFARLHTEARFRALIRSFAHQSHSVLVTPEEPGQPLSVEGIVRDAHGEPLEGALVYAFQTDASGVYSHGGRGEENPRLFGYLRTDRAGRFGFRTIRPGAYPDTDEPVEQHIHFEVLVPGREPHRWRLGFADDPFWSGRALPRWVAPVARAADGQQSCTLAIDL